MYSWVTLCDDPFIPCTEYSIPWGKEGGKDRGWLALSFLFYLMLAMKFLGMDFIGFCAFASGFCFRGHFFLERFSRGLMADVKRVRDVVS